jgi:hypothetical protein
MLFGAMWSLSTKIRGELGSRIPRYLYAELPNSRCMTSCLRKCLTLVLGNVTSYLLLHSYSSRRRKTRYQNFVPHNYFPRSKSVEEQTTSAGNHI